MTGGATYDGAGNYYELNGIVYNYFNAENQWYYQTSYHISMLYDGDGKKVETSGGASGTRIYIYDIAGNVLREVDQNGNLLSDYFYLGGARMGRANLSGMWFYYGDHLGTSRVITDGNSACYDADYFPWGGEQQVYVNTCPQNYKFTGKERDPDMYVDYFGARMYYWGNGRFYQPDWSATVEPVPYAKLDNPQTLNLYAYVGNNPTTLRDPDGHCYPWCTALGGAIIGGLIGGGSEILAEGLSGKPINWSKVEGSTIQGTVTGAAIGIAGPEAGVVTTTLLGAGGNALGGIANRAIQGQSSKEALNPTEVAKDAASGAVGGAIGGSKIGEKAGEFVAENSAKVAAASGDQTSANLFSNNASAIGTGVAKAIDLGQGTAENYLNQKPAQIQPSQQQPHKDPDASSN